MRKIRFVLAACTLLVGAGPAAAELLGVAPGYPMTSFTGISRIAYNAETGVLSLRARPESTRFSTGTPPVLHDAATEGSLQIAIRLDRSGGVLGGFGGDDLVVRGAIDVDGDGTPEFSGILLSGRILRFGFHDSGAATDTFDFRFTVDGGALVGLYAGSDVGVRVTTAGAVFTGTFDETFKGTAQGIVGPIDPTFDCGLTVASVATPDSFEAPPVPSCRTEGRPATLTFRYTGGGCLAGNNAQDPKKAECTGAVDNALAVAVAATGGTTAYPADPATVPPGGEFTVSPATGFEPGLTIALTNAGGTETATLDTSCAQPLRVGDVFGSLMLVAINGAGVAGTPVTYDIDVANQGETLHNVRVVGDRFGALAQGVVLNPLDAMSFTAESEVFETNTTTVTAQGWTADGHVCQASATTTVTVLPPPEPVGSCADGKPWKLVFEYTGESCLATTNDQDGKLKCKGDPAGAGPVQVHVKRHKRKVAVLPVDQSVGVGDLVSIETRKGKKLPRKLDLHIRELVDGKMKTVQKLKIHASCSKPLNVGDRFGGLILRAFEPAIK